MKALVATKESQGARRNDFCFVPEGELVTLGSECDGESVDGGCGCRRSLVGTLCRKATTTFKVVELEGGLEALRTAIRESYRLGKWDELATAPEIETMVKADVRELLRVSGSFAVGDVLEKRGSKVQTRNRDERTKLWRLR